MRKFALLAVASAAVAMPAAAAPVLTSTELFATPFGGPAEIPAYDARFNRLFVSAPGAIKYFDATTGAVLGSINYAAAFAGSPNSVAISGRRLAIAVEATVKTDPGRVLVYDLRNLALAPQVYTVGSLPDQLTFTPDGQRILVANEGEPSSYGRPDSVDPAGSVSIINLGTGTVATAGFAGFNGQLAALRAAGVRISGPGATVAQDLEPEYVAVSPDGTRALVTLQEANAVAIIDIAAATVTSIRSLGFKDLGLAANAFDVNDQNGAYVTATRPDSYALFMPDAIASFTSGGQTFYITANEGDAREYPNVGGADVNSDIARFSALGGSGPFRRLEVIRPSNWGVDAPAGASLLTIGGRSFSILDANGNRVFDSENLVERIVTSQFPANFDDGRSDNKGPEPEDVEIGIIDGRVVAFIGLERSNGTSRGLVLAFDVTEFAAGVDPVFLGGISSASLGRPEGLAFFRRGAEYFLAAADEQTNRLVVFRVGLFDPDAVPTPAAFALFGLGAAGVIARRRRRA